MTRGPQASEVKEKRDQNGQLEPGGELAGHRATEGSDKV